MFPKPKSVLDMTKKVAHPPLYEDEELLKTASGSIDDGHAAFSTWKPCLIHLTSRRLIAAQIRKVVRQFRIDQISNIDIVMRKWIAGKKVPQMAISMRGMGARRFYIAVDKPDLWLKQIAELGGMKVKKQCMSA